MFYCFIVQEDHRDFLSFLWFEDNNPSMQITEYLMKMHAFGNSPSPAVAIYGLRNTTLHGAKVQGAEAKQIHCEKFLCQRWAFLFFHWRRSHVCPETNKGNVSRVMHQVTQNSIQQPCCDGHLSSRSEGQKPSGSGDNWRPLATKAESRTHLEPAVWHFRLPRIQRTEAIHKKGNLVYCQWPLSPWNICHL